MKRVHSKHKAGFTMIELMVIVTVIGVIAGLTIPTLVGYFQRQKATGARAELMADLAYARSLAIARRTTFRMQFFDGSYRIIEPGPNTVLRERETPAGITLAADVNPNFYAHGLADAANITVASGGLLFAVQLLPNGTAKHN